MNNLMKKRLLALSMCLVLGLSVFTGCGQKTESVKDVQETEKEEVKEQTITDMAGREVTVPGEIDSIYSTSPMGTNFVYAFDDKLVTGVNIDLSEGEKRFMTERVKSLPNLGGWFGKGNEGNIEEIIKAGPDIVISTGTDEHSMEQAEELESKLNVPVILLDVNFDKLSEAFRLMGTVLRDEKRGNELADYIDKTIKDAEEMAASIPDDERVRVYYAEDQMGLNTDPSGSPHARLIDLCGGVNVADVENNPGYGRTEVSMEQVIEWNPDCIIACVDNGFSDSGSYDAILSEPQWSVIKAVKDGRVYQTPNLPFNWFDRPPSVNTIVGVKWVQSILYPEYVKFDLKEETKKFYSLFYHYDLTDEEYNEIVEKSLGAK